jgi:NAD(P)-dependent dehydrogenase (short-subunit alcohol dehydrogenase family)
MKGVAGRVAVVTGGASGIGRALCEELARRQAVVVVADLNGEQASRVAQALVEAGGSASAAPVDVARAESVRELVRDTLAKHGRIDLMFNNAGIGWAGDFQEMAVTESDRVVAINLKGVLYGASAVYPIMVKQGAGHIVNTASFFSGLLPVPGISVYSATKHAIVGFSLSLREEARAFGVNVSVVCPSFIRTNIDANSTTILRGTTNSTAPTVSSTPEAAALARAILNGVTRNRSIIIMPPFIRTLWWLYRISPWLFFVFQYPIFLRSTHRKQPSRAVTIGLVSARWLFRLLLRRHRNDENEGRIPPTPEQPAPR